MHPAAAGRRKTGECGALAACLSRYDLFDPRETKVVGVAEVALGALFGIPLRLRLLHGQHALGASPIQNRGALLFGLRDGGQPKVNSTQSWCTKNRVAKPTTPLSESSGWLR